MQAGTPNCYTPFGVICKGCFGSLRGVKNIIKCDHCKLGEYCCDGCKKMDWEKTHSKICEQVSKRDPKNIIYDSLESLQHFEFMARSNELKNAPPPECSGELAPRWLAEKNVNHTIDMMIGGRERVKAGGGDLHMAAAAPLTHGVAPELSQCKVISLREASRRVNVIQKETVVFVRTGMDCGMLVGIQMLIEDPDSWWGDAALMGLYDYAMGDEDCQAIFPKHTYLAVMEPYFRHGKDDPNNPTSMRCDNPQHVIKFDTKEEWLRARNELQGFGSQVTVNAQSSQQLCDEGNAHFKRGEFKKAYKLYAEAASAATCDAEKIRAFSNKAMTGIKLEQWEQAVKTAVEVLKLDNVHIKSNYNVSLASLFWQRPEEGEMMCTHLIGGLNININWYEERGYTEEAAADAASLKQATALLADIHRGIDEKRHGIYCLDDMKREAYSTTAGSQEGSAKKLSRKHQDFLSESIELRDCSDRKGSGMFVKADIPAYTLLVACKAFVSSVGKQSQGSISVTTANGQVDTKGRGLELHPIAIRHIIDHPELGEDFYALSAGAAYDGCPLSEEHKRRVDVLRIRATLRANAFSAHVDHGQDSKNQREVLRNSHDASRYAEQMVRGSDKFDNLQHYGESGLWLQSARFNHSCTPNCAYFFIGDFMFIYTTRELRANEEATIIYGPSGGVHTFDETIEYFKDWVGEGDGFRCACPRCAAVQQNNKLKVMENLIYAQHKKAIKWMNKGKQPAACVEKAIASPTRASMRASLEAELNTSFEGAAHTLALLLEMEAHFCFGKNQYMKAYRLCVRQIELLQGVEGRRNGWLIAKLRAAGGAVLVDRAVAAGDDDHPTVGMADAVRHAQEAYDVCCRGDGFKWHWNLDLEDLKLLMRGMMPGDLADMVFARLQT